MQSDRIGYLIEWSLVMRPTISRWTGDGCAASIGRTYHVAAAGLTRRLRLPVSKSGNPRMERTMDANDAPHAIHDSVALQVRGFSGS
jgi:hypothetical protein